MLEVWNGKTTFRKSLAENLLVWMDLTLGPLLQGQKGITNLQSAFTCLLLVLEVWDGKPCCRKSWTINSLVCSDLTLGPSFKVKKG